MDDQGVIVQKNSVRYGKTGAAMYHSHHDLIRFWERAVRRADLPVRMTQGFNPRPRLVFPHALGVGIASLHEEVEMEFSRRIENADILDRLRYACRGVLDIRQVTTLPPVKKGRTAKEFRYEISGWPRDVLSTLTGAIDQLLAKESVCMRRGAPGAERRVDIRPYLRELRISDGKVLAKVMNSLAGTARPDEIAGALADECGVDASALHILKTGMALD
ncbi:MAG: TIGR03936 family radical SAM-associated protein [Planctomycetota bacterium]|nr:TIGR03936 family radical SAM-associated protein [Planctomycetota bacterium]